MLVDGRARARRLCRCASRTEDASLPGRGVRDARAGTFSVVSMDGPEAAGGDGHVVIVGGGDVAVRALMGPGVDPHAYRQTRSDISEGRVDAGRLQLKMKQRAAAGNGPATRPAEAAAAGRS